MIQNTRALETRGANISNRLKKFIDEDLTTAMIRITRNPDLSSRNMPEFLNRVEEALKSNRDIKDFGFSEGVTASIESARVLIDDLTETLLGSSLVGKGALRETLVENLGQYARVSYKRFEDAGGYKPSDDVIDSAVRYLAATIKKAQPSLNPEEVLNRARIEINDLLHNKSAVKGVMSSLRINTKTILNKREHIPDEIKALYGPITDPAENIALTISKMAQVTEKFRFFTSIFKLGENKYLFNEKARKALSLEDSKIFNEQIDNTDSMLDGMYTTKEMKLAIEGRQDRWFQDRVSPLAANLLAIKGFHRKVKLFMIIKLKYEIRGVQHDFYSLMG